MTAYRVTRIRCNGEGCHEERVEPTPHPHTARLWLPHWSAVLVDGKVLDYCPACRPAVKP